MPVTEPYLEAMSPSTLARKPEKTTKARAEKKRKRGPTQDEDEPVKRKKTKSHRPRTASTTPECDEEISPFHLQTSSLFLPLSPISQKFPVEGMCAEHLSPLILTYYPPFNGLILSYSNPKLSQNPFNDDGDSVLLKSIDEYGVSWAWVTAEFLVLKPEKGASLEGYINLQNDGHLGVVCWNLFNASIERKRLPADWEWRDGCEAQMDEDDKDNQPLAGESSGYYVDGHGEKVEGMIKFRVADVESSQDRERGFLTIMGTMLSVEEEAQLVISEKSQGPEARSKAGRRLGGPNALGATNLGVIVDGAASDMDEIKYKPRR
ncbi:DNA-directed RNA polymerase I subunit RPA43 [Blumeria hordei DH14]|uniref:DNA-directed RNA polymerase subunit n=1 Tax=Blumeria graminis f. sp. hordei (strain DH14) TaxID=546991 RepID=N1JFA8_BLUG1|nr:DNA-directed RNA polymerase I subunit RPA43 [Blumeria hordei DH14]